MANKKSTETKADKKPKAKKEEKVKDELVESLLVDLNKKTPEVATTLTSSKKAQVNGWIPSGSPDIDEVLGGGYPMGRVIELFGPESNGKTTVALHAIAQCQQMGGVAVFMDTEHALSKERAKTIGVNLDTMVYSNPETMENVFKDAESIIDIVRKKDPERPILIVWDSVAATAVNAEIEGDYDDQHVGIHARVMSQSLRKITKTLSNYNITFICINQVRDKVGVSFGEKSTTPGGRALKFYASVRLEIVKIGQHKEGGEVAGIKCIAIAKKNKVAPPFKKANFNILFDDEFGGIDTYGSVLDIGFEQGIFGSSKGWYEVDKKKMRKVEARKYFQENRDSFQKYYDTIKGNM